MATEALRSGETPLDEQRGPRMLSTGNANDGTCDRGIAKAVVFRANA